MKILIFIESLRPGGKERRVVELIRGMNQLYYTNFELVLTNNIVHYKSTLSTNIKIQILPKDNYFKRVYSVLKICIKSKPDIIHSWGYLESVFVLPYLFFNKTKLINSMISTGEEKITTLSSKWLVAKLTFPFSAIILSNSFSGLKSFKISFNKRKVIHNGFDFKRIKKLVDKEDIRRELNINSDITIGMVATFSKKKDYKTLIEVAISILNCSSKIVFILIGDGPELLNIKNAIPKNFRNNFVFTGTVRNVESFINIFNIGILLSNSEFHAEGISNSIMEYMALGKPVIATKGGGTSEIVMNNQTGFLIEPKNQVQLENKINFLLSNPDLAKEMGEKGKIRIKEHFSLDKMVDETYQLYNEVLQNNL